MARARVLALFLATLPATALAGQQAGAVLTLEEAIELARRNNPGFLIQAEDRVGADWSVREAYGQLLPGASAGGGVTYTQAGVQRIGTLAQDVLGTDYLSSRYNLSLSWSLDGGTLFGLASARAGAAATDARIDAARFSLESTVTLQYMSALRAGDALDVARRQQERAERNLELVRTRVEAGAAAGIDGRQAEVELGRAEVAVLQAERTLRAEKLRLVEQIGVAVGEDVVLASGFEVFEPTWTREELLAHALSAHPALRAQRAQEQSARAGLRQARSQYFPSLSLSTGLSGNALQARSQDFLARQVENAQSNRQRSFENCQAWHQVGGQLGVTFPGVASDCGSPALSPSERAQILAAGDFSALGPFTKNPLSLSLSVSIPVFNGLRRERQLGLARAAARRVEHQRRAEELRITTEVTQHFDGLGVAYRVVEIEARNRDVAEERLALARQRYALGAAGLIELMDAETSMSTAERDYLNAVYQFHQSLVVLEAASGRALRDDLR